jgi:thymidylate synthase (FAD)
MKAEYIDHMGSDLRVVNAARVSFNKHSEELNEKDEKLISYLSKHNHFTPFTHCVVSLRETVPIFVARQRFKHTVGFSYNEVSRRYVDDEPTFYVPTEWRKKAENKKQGSSDELVLELSHEDGAEDLWADLDNKWHPSLHVQLCNDNCLWLYNHLLDSGVAPEQARMVLPQSMYTSYYVTGSLSAWARAYNLRSDPHAQLEIQDLAKQWNEIIRPLFPVSWEALCGSS